MIVSTGTWKMRYCMRIAWHNGQRRLTQTFAKAPEIETCLPRKPILENGSQNGPDILFRTAQKRRLQTCLLLASIASSLGLQNLMLAPLSPQTSGHQLHWETTLQWRDCVSKEDSALWLQMHVASLCCVYQESLSSLALSTMLGPSLIYICHMRIFLDSLSNEFHLAGR